MFHHLTSLEAVDVVKVIYMFQYKINVPALSAFTQVISAWAFRDDIHRNATPLFDN